MKKGQPMRLYRIYHSLNISEIRAILKGINKLKLNKDENRRVRKFFVDFEIKLAHIEIEAIENKLPYHLQEK